MAACSSRPTKEAKVESTLGPNWLDLPTDITAKILHKLGPFEIFTTASLVCTLWWKICMDPLIWRTIHLINRPPCSQYKLAMFCRHAIKRSCGHLEDITIEYIGTDEVLKYIADSGSQLRRMQLLKCWEISDKQLSEVVKKLPLLEEFEISFSYLSKDTLELMGKCCPNLKVLKFNMKEQKGFKYDDEAFAIAKTMPRLLHLQLLGNRLTNKGLLAILDGCPHLESLDLRVCSNIELNGSLRERCCKQIRDLRFPEDLSEVSIYVEDEQDDFDDYFECDCGFDHEPHSDLPLDPAYEEFLTAEYYASL